MSIIKILILVDVFFNTDDESGITVYCTLENGQLRKYYATTMVYLPNRSAILPENLTLREQIDSLRIEGDFVVTLDKMNG